MSREQWRNKQFNILQQLQKICDDNDITMFLYGRTAIAACRDGRLPDNINVCVDIKDAGQLIYIIQSDDSLGIDVEGMFTNGRYPKFEMRVFDPTTTDFNGASYMKYDNNCLHVTVQLIIHMPNSKFKRKWLKLKQDLYTQMVKINSGESKLGNQKFLKKLILKSMMKKDSNQVGQDTFLSLVNGYSKDTGKSKLLKTTFNSKLFSESENVTINECKFLVPKDKEIFFKKMFGNKWQNVEIAEFEETNDRFRDAGFSWNDFQKHIEHIDLDAYNKNRMRNKKLYKKYLVPHKKILGYYDILNRTHSRITLWQKYEPQKPELMKLDKAREYDKLAGILKEYLDALATYESKGLGISFDPDIFTVAKNVLIHQGKKDYANKLETLIPPEYQETLRVKNYKGEYIDGQVSK